MIFGYVSLADNLRNNRANTICCGIDRDETQYVGLHL